ncbi:MAG: argininosuccinate synthase, partial [Treponema sp.]|nr:argininosuccinate synthase [Treponema sp.]
MGERIVLAFSGGLDTSVIIPWLQENYSGCEIVACCVDIGQVSDYSAIEKRALDIGAQKVKVINAQEEFVTDYIFPMLKAGAIYEGKYLLGTAVARPLIAKKLIDLALAENATAICHGATGKGNDQVRFELTIKAFAPWLKVIVPWRIWDIKSREEEMEYLEKRGIELPSKKDHSYSRDDNMWHFSHEGLELEDPAVEPNYRRLLQMTVAPEDAPDEPEYVELHFENGIPVKLNGKTLPAVELIRELNKCGGRNGVGIVDLLENRVVGMKSRGVYETPGGSILYAAHRELENMCLDRHTASFKSVVALKMSELIYGGEWFSPLRESLQAFVDKTQENVTGTGKLKPYKGSITPA